VEGIYRLLHSDYSMPVNIGNPDEITIMQLAKEIMSLVNNPSAFIDYRSLPEDDPKVRQPDITLARKLLGWEPKIPRAEGLQHTLKYFREKVQTGG
jgi:dTDP-glucose 4,6-dehydratase